jgi:protein-S-isoprenylcysteine O-methyltransferase Ste14
MAARVLAFAYGVVSYVFFLVVFVYAVGFVANVGVPRAIDGAATAPFAIALATDLVLLAIFAVQHSVMARPAFKRAWTRVIPPVVERSTFVLAASLALALLFWQWRPLGGVVWQVDTPWLRALLVALSAFGWFQVLVTTFLIDHFELFGLKQVWRHLRGEAPTAAPFVVPGPYRMVRHPLYLGFLIAFWAAPTMTLAHLVFAAMTTAYIVVAIQLEERDLIVAHPEYAAYRRDVPMLLPMPGRRDDRDGTAPASTRG